jgi:hypothetical protein
MCEFVDATRTAILTTHQLVRASEADIVVQVDETIARQHTPERPGKKKLRGERREESGEEKK